MAVILIVDDDPTVRLIATEMLRASDHAIVEASDGLEALRLLGAMAIDLVVLDMLMPNCDGVEVLMSIRRSQPSVKVLAISSGGRVGPGDYLNTARVLGADAILVKPLRLDSFRSMVDAMVSGRAASAAQPERSLA